MAETKKLIPKRRFKEFQNAGEWEQRKFGEMSISFEYGLNAAAKDFDGMNKYIRITDINDSSRDFSMNDLTSPNIDLNSAENYKLQYGDILFARTGASVGKSYIYKVSDGLVYYAGFLIRARIKKEYNPYFIFYTTLTNKYDKYIRITSQRSGQPGVNAQEYAEFDIIVPEIREQVKISEFLKNLDNLITIQQRKLEKIKSMKKAYLYEVFPAEGESKPKRRFKGFTDDWDKCKLSDVVSLFGGNAFSSQNSVESGARWLKISNVDIGRLKWNEESFLPTSYLEEYSAYRLKSGDYVMALTRPILNHELKIAKIFGDDILLNQRVAKLVFSGDSKFGYQMLRKNSTICKIENELAGTDPPNLSVNTLNHIDVRVPSLTEQIKLGIFFENVDNLITLHQSKLDKLKNLKKSYLNEMFI